MKKLLASTALVATVLFNIPAFAASQAAAPAPQAAQNMQQPSMAVKTIEQVQGLGDDAHVVLEGTITQALGDDMYTFQDPAGNTISVEIDNEDWNGLRPNPNDMVIITGEVDKEGNIIEIDVDTIALKNN
jgi:uncharacterized protein (TIGR00156 family)